MKEKKFHGYSGNSPRLTNSILECQTTWKFAFSEKQKSTSSVQKHTKFCKVNYLDTRSLGCPQHPNVNLTLGVTTQTNAFVYSLHFPKSVMILSTTVALDSTPVIKWVGRSLKLVLLRGLRACCCVVFG